MNKLLAILPGLLLHFVLVSTSVVRHNSFYLKVEDGSLSYHQRNSIVKCSPNLCAMLQLNTKEAGVLSIVS